MIIIVTRLFHGRRSNKSIEELKKEGFCAYGSPEDETKSIIDALKQFGKEKLLKKRDTAGWLIQNQLEQISEKQRKGRLSTYATTTEEAPCKWWARANPEHISLVLNAAGVKEEEIDKYLKEKYGKNCYIIELDLALTKEQEEELEFRYLDYNTGKNCISPEEIKEIRKCKSCNYSNKQIVDNL